MAIVTHSWPIPTPRRGVPVVGAVPDRKRPGRHRKPTRTQRAIRALSIVEKPEARP